MAVGDKQSVYIPLWSYLRTYPFKALCAGRGVFVLTLGVWAALEFRFMETEESRVNTSILGSFFIS